MMKIIQVRENDGDKFFTYGIFFPYLVKHKFSFSFVISFQDQSIQLNTVIPYEPSAPLNVKKSIVYESKRQFGIPSGNDKL